MTTDTDTPAASADLTVTKDDGVATYTPGGSVTYTIVVGTPDRRMLHADRGDGHRHRFVPPPDHQRQLDLHTDSRCGDLHRHAGGSGNISDTVDIPAGESATYSVADGHLHRRARHTGNLVNTAGDGLDPPSATWSNPGDESNSDTDTDTPAASADLT